jgi:hypothetical protein
MVKAKIVKLDDVARCTVCTVVIPAKTRCVRLRDVWIMCEGCALDIVGLYS